MALAYNKKLPSPQYIYVIDFFCGCGGMSYGFENTRQSHLAYKVLAGIDIDEKALMTYAANINSKAIKKDIREIEKNQTLLEELIPDFDPVHTRPLVFIGCAPCQGFSAHRKKDNRDDSRNSLMLSFANICATFNPDIVVMENVPEVITGRFRAYFMEAVNVLQKSEYSLSMDVLDMSLYGLPQRRKRAVLLGAKKGAISLPSPILNRETVLTVRHAINHLATVRSGQCDPFDPMHIAPNHTEAILARIRKTPKNGGDRRALPDSDQLACHASIDGSLSPGFTDVYGRLRWDTPSVTITAKSSTPSCGRFLHPEQDRNITIREAAILQGFPQSFEFKGALVNIYRQIGEAVPPIFARFLAWQILDHFRQQERIPSRLVSVYKEGRQPKYAVDHDGNALHVVDCFCGAGGLGLGFEAAGCEVAFAFDNDADCVDTFGMNISQNVKRVDIKSNDILKDIDTHIKGRQFVVVGGPPCQGFSQQRRGCDDDPRNNLVIRYAETVIALKPRPLAILLENVTYLDSPRGREILKRYLEIIETAGFIIFRHDLNSADYAIPQLRNRILIVAMTKKAAPHYEGPKPLTPHRWRTIGETFSGLMQLDGQLELFTSTLSHHEPGKDGPDNKRRIAYVDMGKGRLCIPQPLQLRCHTKYNGHLDVYGRLDWFSQARTITGGFDSFTRGEYGHPFLHRSITPREAARIQGFPDWFLFRGNRASLRRQIGNAVPPPLAYSVARAIMSACKKANLI